jgi:hypothetical protein
MFNDQIDQIVIEIDKTLEALRGMSSELIAVG